MAAVMRLKRVGMKKAPAYRIVVTDKRNKRDGRPIEEIGSYNPLVDPPAVTLKADRVRYWLDVGATPSDTVRTLLQRAGVAVRPAKQTAAEPSPEAAKE